MTQTLSHRLSQARASFKKRQWFALFLRGGLATILLLFLAALLNHFQPLQEATAFAILAITAAGFLTWIAITSWRSWRHPIPLPEIAEKIETKYPEWMDALICATEQEQKPEGKRRPLERSLIAKVQQESADVDFKTALIPPRWQNRPLLASAAGFVILSLFLPTTSFVQKGSYFFADLFRGESSGLIVSPGNSEAPVQTDVGITAEILRWENVAEIEYIDNTGRHRFPMHLGSDGHHFTFYAIDDDIRYRISTPSLQTDWFQISSFVPPEIEETEIRVTPPTYTGLQEEVFSELRDFSAVEGSEITWKLTAPTAVRGFLRIDSTEHPIVSDGDVHSITISAEKSFTGRFIIEDREERSARTREFRVQVQPDLPPTIEITQPGSDTKAEPEANLPIVALAADDFGLTRATLHLSVSGIRHPPIEVFSEFSEPITERTIRTAIDIANLEVREGDVIVYFFTATDNREPSAQQTQSEVYFIEIREEVDPEEMEGDTLEIEQVDLQALIVELKRLIRLSWQSLAVDDARLVREIAAGLEEARLETARLQQEFISQLGEEAAEPIVLLMNRAIQRMESAGRLIDQDLVNDSLPYQEMALADIVAIQTALEKNQSTSSEPSESSSGEGPPPPETADAESLEDLQRLLHEVEKLSDAQAVQNSALRRARSGQLSPQQQHEYGQRQNEIRQQTENVRRELANIPGTDRAIGNLSSASSAMESASGEIDANEPTSAARAGDRARAALLSAAETLADTLSQATGNEIAQLSQQAQQLAQQQAEAAGGSRGLAESDSPSPEEAAALRTQQEALQQQLEQLLAALDDTAHQLRSENPNAAQALSEAGQQIRDENTLAEMGRAGNALLYRRYERAAEMQENAAESLGEFAQSLHDSASLMPSLSSEQLRQLLAQIQQQQQEMMQMMGQSPSEIAERLEEIASQNAEQLGAVGQALQNETLSEISGALGGIARSNETPNLFRMNDMLRAAARSLEQQIFAMEIDRRARLQRQVSDPPERYRGLVEEYFKNLSETP